MSLYSPIVVALLYLEAFASFYLLTRFWPVKLEPARNAAIDGLRGILAFGVFVHHASIWFVFLKTGVWDVPESRLFAHLGQTTVTLFFMITGYLFFARILGQDRRVINWYGLYRSRVLRIVPLYVVVMLTALGVIALLRYSSWVTPTGALWANKSLLGLYTAGVTWTLAYEWKFYFAVPLLSALVLYRPSWRWVVFGVVMLLLTKAYRAWDIHAFSFLGGMGAAYLARQSWLPVFARSAWAQLAALAGLVGVVAFFDTAYAVVPTVLLGLVFCLVANGTDFWGLLSTRLARAFGEITYSVYLLHGPLLFVAFHFLVGFDVASTFEPYQYWLFIGGFKSEVQHLIR
jgi:peptidoglycan/LPS O-acetylase OafA/YrhL